MNLSGQFKVSLKDLATSLDDGGKVYGSYCGFAGQHPPTRIAIEKLIKAKDFDTISDWLRSPNKVVQTYAAEAVLRLSAEGETFSDEDNSLVVSYATSDTLIPTCTGCMYEKITMKECLKSFVPES